IKKPHKPLSVKTMRGPIGPRRSGECRVSYTEGGGWRKADRECGLPHGMQPVKPYNADLIAPSVLKKRPAQEPSVLKKAASQNSAPAWRQHVQYRLKEGALIAFAALSIYLWMSLFTHDPADPGW